MKSLILATLLLSQTAMADEWSCFLDSDPYKISPVAKISREEIQGKMQWKLRVLETPNSYKKIFETTLGDKTDDVLALFIAKGVKISFYMDESDSMGLAEGSIKSPVMNGSIKCNLNQY